jgi:hypothetical protein
MDAILQIESSHGLPFAVLAQQPTPTLEQQREFLALLHSEIRVALAIIQIAKDTDSDVVSIVSSCNGSSEPSGAATLALRDFMQSRTGMLQDQL